MTAKPKICLLDDWRRVLRRAWSIRFSLLAAAVKAAASSEKRMLQARRNTRRQSSRRQIFGLAVIGRLPSAST